MSTRILPAVPLAISLLAGPLMACPACRGAVEARVYGPGFAPTLLLILLPIGVVLLVASALEIVQGAVRRRDARP